MIYAISMKLFIYIAEALTDRTVPLMGLQPAPEACRAFY